MENKEIEQLILRYEKLSKAIVEELTSYYGKSRNYHKLYGLVEDVVEMILTSKSFESTDEFLGYHNPEFHTFDGKHSDWWVKMEYMLHITDKIGEFDEVDELFMAKVISIIDFTVNQK